MSQRLIWAGNLSNLLFKEILSAVKLQSLDIFGPLYLKDGGSLHLAGCGISQYYNLLKVPVELVPLLGLPKIRAELLELLHLSGSVTFCLTCIPMAATFSVAFAQVVITAVLRKDKLPVPSSFASMLDAKILEKRNEMMPYIDDINLVSTSEIKTNRDRTRSENALASVNMPKDPKKRFSSCNSPLKEANGLAWWKKGVLIVKPSFALRLLPSTTELVSTRRAIQKKALRVLDLWIYALLLRRPAFSILSEKFRFSEEPAP